MNRKITILSVAAIALLGVALVGSGGSVANGSDQAKLPGDAGPGPYVQGCVDCHVEDGAGSIGALLDDLGHKNVDKDTGTVPGDCADCHSEDGGYTPLSELAHLLHFEDPANNAFIRDYGGNCLHCHALDASTGVISVKSGPKNW
jgi:hypothetical protein